MKYTILVFALCTLFASCNQSPEEDAFVKFKKEIPLLKLPYTRYCSDKVTHLHLKMNDTIFKKYAPKGASGIIGMFIDSDNYSAILYSVSGDIEYPVIQTYDIEGNKLNDLGLITGGCCGRGKNCSGTSWGTIEKDLSVTIRDSEMTMIRAQDDTTEMVKGLRNRTERYLIDSTGHVKMKYRGGEGL